MIEREIMSHKKWTGSEKFGYNQPISLSISEQWIMLFKILKIKDISLNLRMSKSSFNKIFLVGYFKFKNKCMR